MHVRNKVRLFLDCGRGKWGGRGVVTQLVNKGKQFGLKAACFPRNNHPQKFNTSYRLEQTVYNREVLATQSPWYC